MRLILILSTLLGTSIPFSRAAEEIQPGHLATVLDEVQAIRVAIEVTADRSAEA